MRLRAHGSSPGCAAFSPGFHLPCRGGLCQAESAAAGVNGRELHRNLEALVPGLKVLYMSGCTDNAIGHHGIPDEGVDFIRKPVTVQEITPRVPQVLDA